MRLISPRALSVLTAMLVVPALTLLAGAGPSFVPDSTFQGSSLAGWRTLGDAAWQATNGEIVGTPKQATGGWLVLDRGYQDIGVFASFRCAAGCRTGVLLRAEKAGAMRMARSPSASTW